MFYSQFTKSLKKPNVVESIRSYRQLIERTDDGKILINGLETELQSIEEARQYIKQDYISHKLEEQISKQTYEELSEYTVANIIKEYHDTKVTDTLIEEYIELASSKQFIADPVIQEIRKINSVDNLIEGKIDYKLNDGSIVAIDESTNIRINNILAQHSDVADYMRESKENFLNVIREL